MGVEVVKAEYSDALKVAVALRPFDVHEIRTFRRRDPQQTVLEAFAYAENCWAVRVNGEPVAIIGIMVQSHVSYDAIPFFFATEWPEKHKATFARYSRPIYDKLDGWNLRNFTLASNHWVLRWLTWLGFRPTSGGRVNGHDIVYFDRLIGAPNV